MSNIQYTLNALQTLRKTGTFTLRPSDITYDTSFIISFYDDNKISNFIDKRVCYLGAVGLCNGEDLNKKK
jgi:hypothetical protein